MSRVYGISITISVHHHHHHDLRHPLILKPKRCAREPCQPSCKPCSFLPSFCVLAVDDAPFDDSDLCRGLEYCTNTPQLGPLRIVEAPTLRFCQYRLAKIRKPKPSLRLTVGLQDPEP